MAPSVFPSTLVAPVPRIWKPTPWIAATDSSRTPSPGEEETLGFLDEQFCTSPSALWDEGHLASNTWGGDLQWGTTVLPSLRESDVRLAYQYVYHDFNAFALRSREGGASGNRLCGSKVRRRGVSIRPKGLVRVPYNNCVCFWFGDMPFVSSHLFVLPAIERSDGECAGNIFRHLRNECFGQHYGRS